MARPARLDGARRRWGLALLMGGGCIAWSSDAAAQLSNLTRALVPPAGRPGVLDAVLAPVAATLQPVGGALAPLTQPLAPVGQALAPAAPILAPVMGAVDRVAATPPLAPVVGPVVGTLKPVLDPVAAPLLPAPLLPSATPPSSAPTGAALVDAVGATLGGVTRTVQPVVATVGGTVEAVLTPVAQSVLTPVASAAAAPLTQVVGQVAAPVTQLFHARLVATEAVLPGVEAFAAPVSGGELATTLRADGSIDLAVAQPPAAGPAPAALQAADAAADTIAPQDSRTRLAAVVRRAGARIERLPEGPAVRGQVLAVSPAPKTLDALRKRGFAVLSREPLEAAGEELVVLSTPRGRGLDTALELVVALDPRGLYAANHLYVPAGAAAARAARPSPSPPPRPPAAPAIVVGLLDQGVDAAAPSLRGVTVRQARFAAGPAQAGPHGLAVASLLVADAARGATPSVLYAADIYGRDGAADAASVARALAWMARERVPVVNLSFVGPDNALVASLVARLLAGGQIVVAAAGNDGPAAPPLFPAALPGVVAVTGVDRQTRVLPEAGRGAHVDFAAPAAGLVAGGPSGVVEVRGTSFAAPLVAARLARGLPRPDAGRAAAVVAGLGRSARDLGAVGRDVIYGDGLVAEDTAAWPRAQATPRRPAAGPRRTR